MRRLLRLAGDGELDAETLRLGLRGDTLKEIEHGNNETAQMAEIVAMTIVHCHLRTMDRINVTYDLLPRESDILHLKFWEHAFQLLRERDAIFFEKEGKNAGCWVMRLEAEGHEDDKIIVRSNGTVTYVGKDIAYQLWKVGLLDKDFNYVEVDPKDNVWATTTGEGQKSHPAFGHGNTVYNVIDVRQSYLQNVVRQGLLALGYEDQARRSIHFQLRPENSCKRLTVTPEKEDRQNRNERCHRQTGGIH